MSLPYQSVPDVAQFQMIYAADGQRVQNDLYFHKEGDWAQADLNAAIAAIGTEWASSWQALLPTEMELSQIIGTGLTSLDSPRVAGELPAPLPGTNVSPALPLNVTLAIKLQTASRGRGRNGRIFWPALCEAQVVANEASAAFVTDAVDAVISLQGVVVASGPGITPVVVHRYRNGARLMPGEFSAIVEVVSTDRYIDSQKNRLPFHKKHKKKVVAP